MAQSNLCHGLYDKSWINFIQQWNQQNHALLQGEGGGGVIYDMTQV